MALATQCPHCQTTFRVAHDQLKLRAGLVRCGACKQIFNGIEHLLRPAASAAVARETTVAALALPLTQQDTSGQAAGNLAAPIIQPATATPAAPPRAADADDFYPAFDEMDPGAPKHPVASSKPGMAPLVDSPPVPLDSTDPLQRMTLMHFSYDDDAPDEAPIPPAAGQDFVIPLKAPSKPAPEDTAPDEIDQALDKLQRQPWRSTRANADASDNDATGYDTVADEPSFVTHGRQRKHLGRNLRAWLIACCVLLALSALVQTLFVFRNQIAARLLATKPVLVRLCSVSGCSIDLLAQASAVSIESNELVAIDPAKNRYALTVLLLNNSDLPQRWPSIELTLLDASDRPVLRRVFSAGEYLQPAPDISSGFGPKSERTAKVAFELQQEKVSNYRVYLFYP
ncbi:DUF3426 domain-containing protein [Actimicrobium antarcticum]|uniref:Zinc finger/thioredoxin putative domain-containing protein n=1 Tax=Actimicrobium antarcticum TaxID=1051899 RepID=A0ABP7TCZ9_9BURK